WRTGRGGREGREPGCTRFARLTGERIQKVLARAGIGSRRQIEQWVREGRLTVNGRKVTPGAQISPRDKIALDGRALRLRPVASAPEVRLYHRPSGRDLKDSPKPIPGLG